MNLKEAQMLGILALIAVGIILLCMWGGGDDLESQVAGSDTAMMQVDPSIEPSIVEICDILLRDDSEPDPAAPREEATIDIGGPYAEPPMDPAEADLIRHAIEETPPEDIPLAPPADTGEPPKPESEQPVSVVHEVKKGETLSGISKRYYGASSKWRLILEANKALVRDPKRLLPGMKLTIPTVGGVGRADMAAADSARVPLSATAEADGSPQRTHTVKKGDTLFRISLRWYGDGAKWREILAANQHHVRDPRQLKPGVKLVIP